MQPAACGGAGVQRREIKGAEKRTNGCGEENLGAAEKRTNGCGEEN